MQDKVRVLMDEQTRQTLDTILGGLSDALRPLGVLGEIDSSLRSIQDRLSELENRIEEIDEIKYSLERLQQADAAGMIGAMADAFESPASEWLHNRQEGSTWNRT